MYLTQLLTLLIICSHTTYVNCIECYQCKSSTDIECSERFDEKSTKLRPEPCDHVHEARYCIKSTGMYEGQIGTTRFCSSRDLGDKCDYIKRKGDDRYHRSCVFTCSSYACNKGSQLLKTNNLIMALVLTLIIRINA